MSQKANSALSNQLLTWAASHPTQCCWSRSCVHYLLMQRTTAEQPSD